MLNSLGRQPQTKSKDNNVAKKIIDIIFINTVKNIREDNEMNGMMKGIILGQIPKVINYSKEHINKMSPLAVKMLLDNIQAELRDR